MHNTNFGALFQRQLGKQRWKASRTLLCQKCLWHDFGLFRDREMEPFASCFCSPLKKPEMRPCPGCSCDGMRAFLLGGGEFWPPDSFPTSTRNPHQLRERNWGIKWSDLSLYKTVSVRCPHLGAGAQPGLPRGHWVPVCRVGRGGVSAWNKDKTQPDKAA